MISERPLPWSWHFVEMGGYDCMTDAIYVNDVQGRMVCCLDLNNYGQSRHATAPHTRVTGEAVAQFIVDQANSAEYPA